MYSLLLCIIYLAFISLGLPDSVLGAAWPVMYEEMAVPVSYAGVISMIISGGTIVSSLMSERITRRLGTGRVLVISVLMTAAAMLGFSLSSSFYLMCILALPYGLGAGAVDAALNNYVALHYSARHMSWLHCFWGIGAAAGPNIMSFCLAQKLGWPAGYQIVSVFQFILTGVLFISLPVWRRAVVYDPDKGERPSPEDGTHGLNGEIDGAYTELKANQNQSEAEGNIVFGAPSVNMQEDHEREACEIPAELHGISYGKSLESLSEEQAADINPCRQAGQDSAAMTASLVEINSGLDNKKSAVERTVANVHGFGLIKIPGVKYILMAFLAYCAFEAVTGLWGGSYLVFFHGFDAETAARYVSYYYIGITAGRFICGFISERLGDRKLIRIGLLIISAGVFLFLIPGIGKVTAPAGMIVAGLGCAPVYPSVIHSTPFNFGRENSQAIIGISMASAYIGATFMPPLFGLISRGTGMWIYPFFLAVLVIITLTMTEKLNRTVKDRGPHGDTDS